MRIRESADDSAERIGLLADFSGEVTERAGPESTDLLASERERRNAKISIAGAREMDLLGREEDARGQTKRIKRRGAFVGVSNLLFF